MRSILIVGGVTGVSIVIEEARTKTVAPGIPCIQM